MKKDFIMRKMLKPITLFLKGFVLGISMVLPGLSGGTMAFVMGIYEKLIEEISKTQIKHLKKLFLCLTFKKQQIKESLLFFLTSWDWTFLIPLGFGIVFSGILFIAFAPQLIEQYSLQFYSLVCGLVLASLFKPFKEMKKTAKTFFLFFISFVINFILFAFGENLSLFSGDSVFLIFFPVGFLVSSALIVPGLSGSYLLVLFGLYEKTLLALREGDFLIIIFFLSGAIAGVFSVAKLIQRMIKNHFDESMAVILGLILSSLYAIYPLPKESITDILSFDMQKKIFLLYFISSSFVLISLSFFYEKRTKLTTF